MMLLMNVINCMFSKSSDIFRLFMSFKSVPEMLHGLPYVNALAIILIFNSRRAPKQMCLRQTLEDRMEFIFLS